MSHYVNLTKFKLSSTLEHALKNLDWQNLPVALWIGKIEYLQRFFKNRVLISGFKHYGWFFRDAGSVVTYKLPEDIEHRVRDELKKCYGEILSTQAIIRLQIVFSGRMVPIHIDKNRRASIVYPLLHQAENSTVFYDYKGDGKRDVLDPGFCEMQESVSITETPVLMSTDTPHAIVYGKNSYTKSNPRISLSIKFSQLSFSEIKDIINSKS